MNLDLVLSLIVFCLVSLAVALIRQTMRKRKLLAFFKALNCDTLQLMTENATETPGDKQPADRAAQVLDHSPLDAISAGSRTKTILLSASERNDPQNPYMRMMKLAGVQKLPCNIRYEQGQFVGEFTGKRTY